MFRRIGRVSQLEQNLEGWVLISRWIGGREPVTWRTRQLVWKQKRVCQGVEGIPGVAGTYVQGPWQWEEIEVMVS